MIGDKMTAVAKVQNLYKPPTPLQIYNVVNRDRSAKLKFALVDLCPKY